MSRSVVGFTVLALSLGACESVSEPALTPVRASVQAENVRAGSTVAVQLINTQSNAWSVSRCPYGMQRLGDGGWRSVPMSPCEDADLVLDGAEPVVVELQVPASAEFGVYRVVYDSYLPFPAITVAAQTPTFVYSNQFYVPAFR